jgi:hypothetical protein
MRRRGWSSHDVQASSLFLSIKGSKGGCTSGDKATVTGEGKTGTEKYQVRKSVMQKEEGR